MEWSEELSTQFCQVLSPDTERKAMKGTGRGEQTAVTGTWVYPRRAMIGMMGDTWKTTAPERTSSNTPKAGKGGREPLTVILREGGMATPSPDLSSP